MVTYNMDSDLSLWKSSMPTKAYVYDDTLR